MLFYIIVGAELSVIASFNDTRCGDGGVCSTDPLLFTCNITGSLSTTATVTLTPSGDVIQLNHDNSTQGMIPARYILQSTIVSMNGVLNNFILIFSIESASLLNGSDIICNSGLSGGIRMARCPVAGKFSVHVVHCTVCVPYMYSIMASLYTQILYTCCKAVCAE